MTNPHHPSFPFATVSVTSTCTHIITELAEELSHRDTNITYAGGQYELPWTMIFPTNNGTDSSEVFSSAHHHILIADYVI